MAERHWQNLWNMSGLRPPSTPMPHMACTADMPFILGRFTDRKKASSCKQDGCQVTSADTTCVTLMILPGEGELLGVCTRLEKRWPQRVVQAREGEDEAGELPRGEVNQMAVHVLLHRLQQLGMEVPGPRPPHVSGLDQCVNP